MQASTSSCIWAVVFAVGLVPALASAQPRDRPVDAPQLTPLLPRCSAQVRALDCTTDAAPDTTVAPVLVSTDGGVLVAWRTRQRALMLSVLTQTLERARDDREIARPAGSFAAAVAPGGAAIVTVERQRHGEDALLLARVGSDGEARNVPRELVRANGIDAVAAVWSGNGYVVAWSIAGDARGTFTVVTDARGVPLGGPRRVLDATSPRLTVLAGSGDVVLSVTGPGGEAVAAVLDSEGSPTESVTWPPTARRMAAGPPGFGVLSIGLPTAADGATTPTAVRWAPGAPPTQSDAPIRLAAGSTTVDLVGDHAGLIASIDDPSGRELIARIAPDGAASILATRTGTLGVLFPTNDGTIWVMGHEPATPRPHFAMVQVVCPRPNVVVTPPNSTSSGEATNNDSASRSMAAPRP